MKIMHITREREKGVAEQRARSRPGPKRRLNIASLSIDLVSNVRCRFASDRVSIINYNYYCFFFTIQMKTHAKYCLVGLGFGISFPIVYGFLLEILNEFLIPGSDSLLPVVGFMFFIIGKFI